MSAAAIEARVAANYGGGTLARILGRVDATGLAREGLRHDDLKRFDSLHLGGWRATEDLLDPLGIGPGTAALDIGCGVGGAARTLAARYSARVEGIDLTPEFVAAAEALTALVGLDGVTFQVASAAALPFPAETFELAVMFHVGMNLPEKTAAFAEAARVLRPGGQFAVFDVMRVGPGAVAYPMPWAAAADVSFLATPDDYAAAAAAAGLRETGRRSRAAEAVRFLEAMRADETAGMPPDRLANVTAAVTSGALAPVEMIMDKAG